MRATLSTRAPLRLAGATLCLANHLFDRFHFRSRDRDPHHTHTSVVRLSLSRVFRCRRAICESAHCDWHSSTARLRSTPASCAPIFKQSPHHTKRRRTHSRCVVVGRLELLRDYCRHRECERACIVFDTRAHVREFAYFALCVIHTNTQQSDLYIRVFVRDQQHVNKHTHVRHGSRAQQQPPHIPPSHMCCVSVCKVCRRARWRHNKTSASFVQSKQTASA